jgi:hypothetical protein
VPIAQCPSHSVTNRETPFEQDYSSLIDPRILPSSDIVAAGEYDEDDTIDLEEAAAESVDNKRARSLDFDAIALDDVKAVDPPASKTEPSEGSDGFDLSKSASPAVIAKDRRRRRDLSEKLVEETESVAEKKIDAVQEQGTEEFPDAQGVSCDPCSS